MYCNCLEVRAWSVSKIYFSTCIIFLIWSIKLKWVNISKMHSIKSGQSQRQTTSTKTGKICLMVMSNYAGLRFHLCHGWREVRRCIFLLVLSSFSQNRCWKGSFASYCTALSSICPAPPKRFTWGSLDSQQNPRPRLLSRLLCHLRGTCKQLPKEENQCD